MTRTKNIIFDLGGVLLNIDYNKTRDAFCQLGFQHFEQLYTQYSANDLFQGFEEGRISNDLFYETLQRAHAGLKQEDIKEAWNAMLLDFRLPSLEFLKGLSATHRLFLLSNTNAVHYTAFREIYARETGVDDFDEFFSTAYYSHLVGLRKPGKEIFEFVVDDAELEISETIFIDDSYNNIETAIALGFKTHLLIQGETIETLDYS